MKKMILVGLLAAVVLQGSAQFTKASLQASGLTCSMCNNAIYKALKALPFVASVESDIKKASFDIAFKKEERVDIDALRSAVEDAGFSVAAFTLTGNFNNLQVADDKHVVIGDTHLHFLKANERVLNGQQTLTVVDKGFLTAKNFRKYAAATKMDCVQTGKAGACCKKEGMSEGTRVFHVTI